MSAPSDLSRTADPIQTGVASLEAEERLDAVAERLEPIATRASEGALGHLLRGDWLGHALHPVLTDFPLGCWISAGLLDLVGGRRSRFAATRLVGLGLLAVPPTVASGMAEFDGIDDPAARRVGAAHAVGNTGVALMYLLSWRARRRGHHLRGVAWALGGGGMAWVTGYLGGHLSLALGVGTGRRGVDHDVSDPGITLLESADTAGAPVDTSP